MLQWSLFPLANCMAESVEDQALISNIKDITTEINNVTKDIGLIAAPCLDCTEKSFNKKIILKDQDTEIDTPHFILDGGKYVLRLVRTKTTPPVINLRFKNFGGKRCVVATDLVTMSKGYGTCAMEASAKRDEEVSLDLSELPELEDGKEEIIELTFSKPDIRAFKYNLNVDYMSSLPTDTIVKEKSFLSWFIKSRDGFNIALKPKLKK